MAHMPITFHHLCVFVCMLNSGGLAERLNRLNCRQRSAVSFWRYRFTSDNWTETKGAQSPFHTWALYTKFDQNWNGGNTTVDVSWVTIGYLCFYTESCNYLILRQLCAVSHSDNGILQIRSLHAWRRWRGRRGLHFCFRYFLRKLGKFGLNLNLPVSVSAFHAEQQHGAYTTFIMNKIWWPQHQCGRSECLVLKLTAPS